MSIGHTITLGIGTPAGISEFLTFGLGIAEELLVTKPGLEYTLPESRTHYALAGAKPRYTMPANRLHYTMPEED